MIWEIWETGQVRVSIVTSLAMHGLGVSLAFAGQNDMDLWQKAIARASRPPGPDYATVYNRHERSIVLPLTVPIAQQAAYRCKDIEGRTARESRNLGRSMGLGCLMTILFLPSRTLPAHCAQ
jgi:hypothetical protein